jgi:thioredoxin-related protein
MKKPLLTLLIVFCISTVHSQKQNTRAKINWLTLDQAIAKNKLHPKKIFIDLYTEWCGWCKRMDVTTFENAAVISYLNQNYYCIKFDAESRDTLEFKNKKYFYQPKNKAHELAVVLMNGQMSYPTGVYLEEDLDIITPVTGYQTPEQMVPILKYINENHYLTQTWEEYIASNK